MRKIKILIAKQITDDEKVILAGLDVSFTIDSIDKATFIFRAFQRKLAENASRFHSKKYTPDARILTYLRVRAQEFKVAGTQGQAVPRPGVKEFRWAVDGQA